MNHKDYTEYEPSMSMLLDGSLSPEQKQAMQDRLEADAGFRRFYLEYIKVHTMLRGEMEGRQLDGLPPDIEGIQAFQAEDSDADHVRSTGHDRSTAQAHDIAPDRKAAGPSPLRFPGVSRYLSIAAGLLIATALLYLASQQFNSHRHTLATVTDSHEAHWEPVASTRSANSEMLAAGEYDLRVGQLELTFSDGTVATLDGPARFALNAADHLHLSRGRVYVIAREGTSGFRVSTPDALAVDLGTEFGVTYDRGLVTQVHVFKGAVNLSASEFDLQGEPRPVGDVLKLVQMQAGTITPGTVPNLEAVADAGIFVRSISSLADAPAPEATLKSWHAYRDRLRTDPDLVAAYDFNRKNRSSMSLTNIASATGKRLNGRLGDGATPFSAPRWTTGRFPGSGALLFTPADKQFVALPADEALRIRGDLTTVWWMMPRNTIHRDFSMVVLGHGGPRAEHAPETAPENHMYAHGLKLGRIRAFHESGEGDNQEVLASSIIKPDTWTQVAIVRDTEARKYHIYINGRLTDSLPYNQNATGGDSPESVAAIGRSGGARLNHFDGKLDELMIYARALTELEIADLYNRSRPGVQ